MPRDAEYLKTAQAQIVGDEPSDQAGSAENEDFSRDRFSHMITFDWA